MVCRKTLEVIWDLKLCPETNENVASEMRYMLILLTNLQQQAALLL